MFITVLKGIQMLINQMFNPTLQTQDLCRKELLLLTTQTAEEMKVLTATTDPEITLHRLTGEEISVHLQEI
jgi:hypothetical protein